MSNKPSEFDALIVGGGLAGLTCAVALVQRGLRIALFEKESIPGGRARSWTDGITGDAVSIGPHILLSEYPNMLHLLEILGTSDRVVWQQNPFITLVSGRTQHAMKMSRLPAPFHFVPGLISDRTLKNGDWLSNIPVTLFVLSIQEQELRQLDNRRATDVLRSFGVSEAYLKRFWSFISMAIMNVPLDLCSAGSVLRFYRRLVGQSGFRIGFPVGGLGELFLPEAVKVIQESDSIVLCDTHVGHLQKDHGAIAGLKLNDGRVFRATHTVSAVTPMALSELISDEDLRHSSVLQRALELRPCRYYSVYLWFDCKLTDLSFWARLHEPNDFNLDFYDLSNINSTVNSGNSLITSNIIYCDRIGEVSDEQIVAQTLAELAEFVPEVKTARLVHQVVNRVPMAVHAPFVGSEKNRPTELCPLPGLILAGDWMQTSLPASMESACASGWRAAELILEKRGESEKLVRPHHELDTLAATIGWGVRSSRRVFRGVRSFVSRFRGRR